MKTLSPLPGQKEEEFYIVILGQSCMGLTGSHILLSIVVAEIVLPLGDTSAGKSTLINLLLGMRLLPVELCECTGVLTEVRPLTVVKPKTDRMKGARK